MSRHIVMTSHVRSAGRFGGGYRKVAVVRLAEGFRCVPAMISPRARGVESVVKVWPPDFRGGTDACEYAKTMVEAGRLAAELDARLTYAEIAADAAARAKCRHVFRAGEWTITLSAWINGSVKWDCMIVHDDQVHGGGGGLAADVDDLALKRLALREAARLDVARRNDMRKESR